MSFILAGLLALQALAITTFDNPKELHEALAKEKAARMEAVRESRSAQTASLDQLNYDATYYDLTIELHDVDSTIAGRVQMDAISLIDGMTQFDVDLYLSLTADSVLMGGSAVPFSHIGNELFITPPATLNQDDPFSVVIYYHGNPASGGFGAFGFNSHGTPAVPMIWSLSEPYYARNWWPCKDTPTDKADSVDIHITCRDDLFATSNGRLIAITDNGDGTKTFDWTHRYPIPTYLVSLAVTNFVQLDYEYVYNGGADTMPVNFWVYPEVVANAEASYPEVVQMIGAFTEKFGPYPFLDDKYAISHFVWGGGMEHQTNTSQSSTWYSWALNAHELAHQWWGDLVTCKTWSDIWLNEGFASWSEAAYREWLYGMSAYHSYMAGMKYTGGGTIYVYDTTSVNMIFHGGRSYDKGAWVVHMLRHVVGDSLFYPILEAYRTKFAYNSATTDDLRQVCDSISGMSLAPFFDDWIKGTYFPRYINSFYAVPGPDSTLVRVRIEQVQASNPQIFRMPIDLQFSDGINNALVQVYNDQRLQWYDLYFDFEPTSMQLDPDEWILRSEYPGVRILTDSLPAAHRDAPVVDTLDAVGGQSPYVWSLPVGESLPPGLTLSSAGVISGTPGVEGNYSVVVKVRDSGAPQTSMEREITMNILQPMRPPGDINADGVVTSADVISLVGYVFKGGAPPNPLHYGDVNLSCDITAADIIYLVAYVFKAGPAPLDGCA